MTLSFAGHAAVVTGAAHGIGRATAELLQSLGARVIGVDRDKRALDEAFQAEGGTPWPGDLGADGVEELAEEIWSRHGPVDLLVNNVGINPPRRFLEADADDFDMAFNTNLRGPWFFTKRLVEHLIEERRRGAIVFVSSLHDHRVRTHPGYSTSKAAVAMLVKELANELGPHGIRVNAVSPGIVRSATNRATDSWPIVRLVPLGRVGDPGEVARMAALLLSEEWSGYVTGANVPVDGGMDLHSWFTGSRSRRAGAIPFRTLLRRTRG
jgi:3-oxoacyl-[acyl-carrier protein] reductase